MAEWRSTARENTMSVTHEKLKVISDARGIVFEPIPGDALSDQRNAHVVMSGPGVVRGNHYHKKGREIMAVMGPALVRVRDDAEIEDVRVPDGEVHLFVFPPGQSHAIKNLSSVTNVLVAFNTVEHDREHPDTEADVLI
jgi:dTDP-4-dehydrorhamnose 3,5-epimerase-like enzyme